MGPSEAIVVVGAGLMGTGIAHAFVVTGHAVLLVDTSSTALATSVLQIGQLVEEGRKLGKLDHQQAEAALGRLATATDLDARARHASLLIETATEQLAIKQQILHRADELLASEALLATNTSALSISEIAAATRRPAQVIGMHFFNPVHKLKLVEIVRGVETSEQSVERARLWTHALGKTGIVVTEAPGFTTSRISALLGNEAMYMLSEGVASAEDIDTSSRLAFNHPMGPLELGDLTGWDTRLSVLQYLHESLGEKFRPCPLITKLVKAGRFGRKVGRGVYEYDSAGQKVPGSGLKAS